MSLGTNIAHKRKALKLSQEYVAEQLGVSRQAVSKWETHQSEPSMNHLIKLAELFDSDTKDLVSPAQNSEKRTAENRIEPSKKDIKMQLSAVFGRILMLISFLGYVGAYFDPAAYQLPIWYLHIWWGALFFTGIILTLIGANDYFHRKSASKKILWLDCLLVTSYFLYEILPFERNINTLLTLLFGIVILIMINIYFFIPTWRK
ncbi:helix-turn-helix transcriptional regulator [Bacillus altitudinis]|uniref:helix-turn-helix domain-containing protein n=1 Tax=Bacillus pumilus TaxID=1408 RepID=UPI0025A30848|nr:helix-turn-helix transcriptional regulator [Bacillus pumilus]MDM5319060.1 helix-turn-helix transcriptional regulator [Bacillus pumilus]MDR4994299.1 helix-turn-helix transcriptional regulator [Bacillus altitudinis]